MAQFDPLIIFPLIWSLLLVLMVYYHLSIDVLLPQFAGIGKFREKKLHSLNSYNSFNISLISKTSNTIMS
jgi:hypothetical protein